MRLTIYFYRVQRRYKLAIICFVDYSDERAIKQN